MKSRPEPVQLPRSAAGTAFARTRNIAAALILGVCVIAGFGVDWAYGHNNLRNSLVKQLQIKPEEDDERKLLMTMVPRHSGDYLRKREEEMERLDLPFK